MDLDASTDKELASPVPTNQAMTDEGSDEDSSQQGMSAQNLGEYLADKYDFQAPRRGDIRRGVVVAIDEPGVIMDFGFKREGFVPAEDLTRLDEETRSRVQIGATIPVFVIRPADRDGRPVLSIHQAYLYQDWLKAEEMMKSGDLYEGEVSGHNRGGLIVKFGKIRGFVPASQVVGLPRRLREEQRRQRLAAMIGQQIGLKIIEVDRQRRRLIFSQRRALRAWQELQRERLMAELTEGETRHGKVTSITNFGAFVDLGGADGLIHVSELSWKRVENPRDVLKIGDEVDVYVLNVDRQRKRIALSLKKLQPDPWTLVDDHYQAGQLTQGCVTRVLDFGAFIEINLGIEGLLHAREMIGTPELTPLDIVHPGEKLLVKIIRIDSRRRRLDLSAKQVRKDEWERWVAEQQTAQEVKEEVAAPEAEAAPGEVIAVGEPVEEEPLVPEAEKAPGEVAEAEVATPITAEPAEEQEAAAAETGEVTAADEPAEAEAVAPEAATDETAKEAEEVIAGETTPSIDKDLVEPSGVPASEIASDAEVIA